jgi:hypothetical protein
MVLVVLAACVAYGCGASSNEAAHKLIEDYMATSTSVERKAEHPKALDELQSRAQSLKGQLPEDFYVRYQRLIEMSRLAISKLDDNGRQQLAGYIQSITGAPPTRGDPTFAANITSLTGAAPSPDMDLAISAAFACGEEALRLEMMLDGETDHEKARKNLAEKLRSRQKR